MNQYPCIRTGSKYLSIKFIKVYTVWTTTLDSIKRGRNIKISQPQNNEGHKSEFPQYNSYILLAEASRRRGNPVYYLNW